MEEDLSPLNYDQILEKKKQFGSKFNCTPYRTEIPSKEAIIFLIGVDRHFNTSDDPQKDKIKSAWQEFLEKTDGKNCIVLVEGSKQPIFDSEDEAVKKGGEPAWITYLATKSGIEVLCPEPDRIKEADYLAQIFGKDQAAYYYFARLASKWKRIKPELTFEEYMSYFTKHFAEVTGWTDYDFSLKHMSVLHDLSHDHPFDPENERCLNDIFNPYKNAVSRKCSEFRDKHIFSELKKLVAEGKNIFFLYGAEHVIAIEPALKALLAAQ